MFIWTTQSVNRRHVAEYFLFIGLFGGSKNIFFDISFYFLVLYEFLNFCHNLTFSFWKSSAFKYHTHLYIHVCVIFLGVRSFYVLVFCHLFPKHLQCILMKLLLLEGGRSLHASNENHCTNEKRGFISYMLSVRSRASPSLLFVFSFPFWQTWHCIIHYWW